MTSLLVYVAAASLGIIQYGWQPLPEGGMEYIIQLDSHALDALRDGQPLQSDIPAAAGEIRSYRIVMGTGTPTRRNPPPRPAAIPPISVKPTPAALPAPPVKATPTVPDAPAKPWLPLTFTLLGFFASLVANLFLGWIAWGFRRRCQNAS